jgi:hypothetical protein
MIGRCVLTFAFYIHVEVALDTIRLMNNLCNKVELCICTLIHTVEPLLSEIMTGCRWPDNKNHG